MIKIDIPIIKQCIKQLNIKVDSDAYIQLSSKLESSLLQQLFINNAVQLTSQLREEVNDRN